MEEKITLSNFVDVSLIEKLRFSTDELPGEVRDIVLKDKFLIDGLLEYNGDYYSIEKIQGSGDELYFSAWGENYGFGSGGWYRAKDFSPIGKRYETYIDTLDNSIALELLPSFLLFLLF